VGTDTASNFKLVLAKLQAWGFLLESDPRLPSVCSLIAGEPLRASWWSHPKAQTIFQVNEQLEDQDDVLITKLISGKVTFVHRQLWPELLAVGDVRADWQTRNLSKAAHALLKMVDREGMVRTDQVSFPKSIKTKPGDAARELERKLLIVASQVHTERGAHAKQLETWQHWRRRTAFKAPKIPVEQAMSEFEERLHKMNEEYDATAALPWP
jgi:hypothetical protein